MGYVREWEPGYVKNGDHFQEVCIVCPICHDGSIVGQTGDSNGHIESVWCDGDSEPGCGPSVPKLGARIYFEQCEHKINVALRFHKGDTYIEWSRNLNAFQVNPSAERPTE